MLSVRPKSPRYRITFSKPDAPATPGTNCYRYVLLGNAIVNLPAWHACHSPFLEKGMFNYF